MNLRDAEKYAQRVNLLDIGYEAAAERCHPDREDFALAIRCRGNQVGYAREATEAAYMVGNIERAARHP